MTRLLPASCPQAARRARARVAPLLVLLIALLLAAAPAQSLPELLPESVAVAIGVQGLNDQVDRLQPFLDEAERLGLSESLAAAVPSEGVEGEAPSLPSALADLGPLDLLGEEAWFAVSASPFQPFPSATVIVRASDAAMDAFRTVIEDVAGQPGVERLEESGRTLYTVVPQVDPDGDTLPFPIAFAQAEEGVLVASTDPEIVRFTLRALAGAQEASMADSELYAQLSGLGEGNGMFMADLLPLTRSLEGLAAGFEAGPLLARLQDALATAGPTVSVTRFTDAGLEAATLMQPDANGPDAALYALLTEGTTAGTEVLAFAPEDAVMVTATTFDAGGWWAWLDDVLASARSLGIPSATELAMMMGLDLQTLLFDWMGDDVVQIQPAASAAPAAATELDMSATQAFLFESTDDQAARQGLDALLQTLGPTISAFATPQGGAGAMAMPETVQVAGHEVRRLTLQDSLTVDTVVVDGWALLSLSPDVTEAVLSARAADDAAPAPFADLASEVSGDLRAWSLSDDRAALLGASDALVAQLQTAAGLAGAQGLDFEAVDEASADLAAFLAFVAERMGTSHATTRFENGALRGEGFTQVAW